MSGSLTDTKSSALSHPKSILTKFRPAIFASKKITCKVVRKVAWFWSRIVKVSQFHLSATPVRDTARGRRVARIIWAKIWRIGSNCRRPSRIAPMMQTLRSPSLERASSLRPWGEAAGPSAVSWITPSGRWSGSESRSRLGNMGEKRYQ